MTCTNEFLDAALLAGSQSLKVFPCRPGTKESAIKEWPAKATLEPAEIRKWWVASPESNVAMAVDRDMVVLDLDAGSRAATERAIGHKFPKTRSVLTPGKGFGGIHLWYKKDPEISIKNRVNLMKDVDVRAHGGYVMLPPSVHPDGGRYQWGDQGPIAEAPDWLIQMCLKSKEGQHDEPVMSLEEMLSGVPMGMQRWAMFRYACSRRSRRYDPEEVKRLLWQAAQGFEQDRSKPWRYSDIEHLVDDVFGRYEALPEQQSGPGKMWTPASLASHAFPTNKWIVKPLLRRGVTVLSSHAKTGKSMMISTLLKSIALGENVWGQFESKKSGVLLLDLEQEEDAAADRWKNIMGDSNLENLRVFFSWPRMDKGGLDEIRNFLMKNADVGVVVIDTWAMFNPNAENASGLNEYYREYDVLGQLKRMANEFGIAVVIVHHFSKASDRPSGTVAFEGAPDGDWRLHREQGSKIAVLNVKGKNTPETKIYFNVDLRSHTWEVTKVE